MAMMIEMPPMPSTDAATNPRKRKKRAPAAGAANDCFKCAERSVKCDRRRPYCSQCLELGKDCSGYKTQLTWGVGVASRGKLRGMSLPVTEAQKPHLDTLQPPKAKRRRDTNAAAPTFLHSTPVRLSPHPDHILRSQPANERLPIASSVETPPMMIWDPTMFSVPHGYQNVSVANSPVSPGIESHHSYLQPHPGDVLFRSNIWPSPQTLSSSPTESNHGPSHLPSGLHVTSEPYHSGYAELDHGVAGNIPTESPASPRDQYLQLTPTKNHFDGITMLLEADQSMHVQQNNLVLDVADDDLQHNRHDDCAVTEDPLLHITAPRIDFHLPLHSPAGISHIGKTSRMKYLINYYAEVISPVIVAFDSPSNPFRTQILRLAENSETLQHAISALAASNLRQRRGVGLLSTGKTAPARRSSFAHMHLVSEYAQISLSPEQQMREEVLHKRLAVYQLNQQLAHPVLRKDDSILATLLILCLFHICDSGIAKFQTQFAGVRKLLTLRGDTQKIGNEDSKWMSRLFTCFDALAATVNDREGQIAGQFLDMSALCGDWALENLAGIDAQLFRTISKLGQLNLLKQGKKIDDLSAETNIALPGVFDPASYAMLDGNGWYSRHDSGVGFGIEDTDPVQDQSFWKKWNEIRNELLAWSLDTTLFDSLSREASYLTPEQRVDLENISQSFRYAALLYTERLAQPQVPSSDASIQHWVQLALSHIKQVVSDVYLLWPLFITGTECIDGDSRDVIRGRCQDIQKDSGFVNNASCLQLLEKVWDPTPHAESPGSAHHTTSPSDRSDSSNGSAFAFRDVMMSEAAKTDGEGEYIVI